MSSLDKYVVMSTLKNRSVSSYLKRFSAPASEKSVAIIAGQSLVYAQAAWKVNLVAPWLDLANPQTNVQLAYDIEYPVDGVSPAARTRGIGPLEPHLSGAGDVGPELAFGKRLADYQPDQWTVYKSCHGSTSLFDDWDPQTSDPKLLFDRTVANAQAYLSALSNGAAVKVFFWIQGTNDALALLSDAQQYQANLTAFIAALRVVFGDQMHFVLNSLHISNTATHKDVIRAAELAVSIAVPGTHLINIDDTTLVDAYHPDVTGVCLLGDRGGVAAVSAVQSGEIVYPPPPSDPYANSFATAEWFLQEASDSHPANVGAETLENNNGTNGVSTAEGLVWQSDSTSNNADWLQASGPIAGNSNSENVAGRIHLSCTGFGATDYLFSKYSGGVGWWIYANADGSIAVRLDSGAPAGQVILTGDHADGTLHQIDFLWDDAAKMLYLKSDVTAEVSVNLATMLTLDNAGPLTVNGLDGSFGGTPNLNVRYAGVCTGANALAFYND